VTGTPGYNFGTVMHITSISGLIASIFFVGPPKATQFSSKSVIYLPDFYLGQTLPWQVGDSIGNI